MYFEGRFDDWKESKWKRDKRRRRDKNRWDNYEQQTKRIGN